MSESSPIRSDEDNELLDQLAECGRLFFQRGWSVGTSSNYSAVSGRDPLRLWLTVSGKDKGRLTREDFVEVNEAGTPIDPEGPKSSAETLLHCVAAERPDVNAVLHTHSVWSTVLSDHFFEQGGIELSGFEMLKGLSGIKTHEHAEWVDIFENTQHIPDLAAKVSERLADTNRPPMHGYLIRKHGLYTWGNSIDEARRHVEIFEFLFECIARQLMLQAVPAGNALTQLNSA